jgi:hypothetical protein
MIEIIFLDVDGCMSDGGLYKTNLSDEFKRFDFGLGLRIGAEIKQKYSLSLGYDFGLLNCWNSNYWGDEDEDIDLVNTVKNRNFYISLGYKF